MAEPNTGKPGKSTTYFPFWNNQTNRFQNGGYIHLQRILSGTQLMRCLLYTSDSDNDGFVEISTIEQLQWFANQTNTGNVLNAVLANDIDLSGREVMIGTVQNPFKGVFDGKGKTISNYTLAVSDNKQGLFEMCIRDSLYRNLLK